MRKLTLLLLALTISSLFVLGCSGSSSTEDGDTDIETDGDFDGDMEEDGDTEDDSPVSEEIEVPVEGGTFTTAMGIELEIPADAVEETTTITITEANDKDTGSLVPVSSIWQFEPAGLEFASPITIKIPYSETLAEGKDINFYWTKKGDENVFEALEGATFDDAIGVAEVSHFSFGFIGAEATVYGISFDKGESFDLDYSVDTDASEDPLFQSDIAISTENIPEGTSVTLTINGEALDPQDTDTDGKVVFAAVTIDPGVNNLKVVADLDGDEDPEAEAVATLKGCRLTFTDPAALQELSDAGGDCATDCGDDLDCNKPNLQYNVELTTENIGAGVSADLSIGAADPVSALVGDGTLTFEGVDMADSDSLALLVEATNSDSEMCEVTVNVSVDLSCDCHLEFVEAPTDYNLASVDADETTEGFQREFTVASDNCLNGSTVSFDLDGAKTTTALTDGEATVMLTLADGTRTLNVDIAETGTDRVGELTAPVIFKVDRVAPTFETFSPEEGKVFTRLTDLNNDLSDGIQFNISGTTGGMETLDPPLEVALTINGTAYAGGNATVVSNGFSFNGVTIEAPGKLDPPVDFVLVLTTSDELGNPVSQTINIGAYFGDPSITITALGTKIVGSDEDPTLGVIILNAADDGDAAADLQTTVTATTILVEDGSTAELSINGQAPITAQVASGAVTWNVSLAYGDQAFVASAVVTGGGDIDSAAVNAFADSVIPEISFDQPLADEYIKDSVLNVELAVLNAEEGQLATLKVNGILHNDSGTTVEVALDANGKALFENVDLFDYSSKVEGHTLQGFITDKAGNAGQSAILDVNLDTTVPTVTVNVPEAGMTAEVDYNDNIEAIITISDDDVTEGRDVILNLYRQSDLVNPIDTIGDDEELKVVSGQASYNFASIADGLYTFEALYTDRAGNEGSGTYNLTVDTGCYTFEISAPVNQQYFNSDTISITVKNTDGGEVPVPDSTIPIFLFVNGTQAGFGAFTAGEYVFTDVELNEGANTLEARATKPSPSQECSTGVITVNVDLVDPTLTLTDPAVADPIKFNAAYQDMDLAKDGFQTDLTFAATEVEEGQEATLTVNSPDKGVLDTVTGVIDADGNVVFEKVTISNLTAPEGTAITFSATVDDLAGNTGTSAIYNALVDRTVPTFVSVSPESNSTLNKNDDALLDPDFQLDMTVVIANGTAGVANVLVQVTDSADPGNPYALGAFDLVYNGVLDQYEANITGTFTEGTYTLDISHTDDFGNKGDISPAVVYTIDYFAELVLRDKNNLVIEDSTLTWNADLDEAPDTDGFQSTFWVSTRGLEDDAWVWLCSDMGSDPSHTVNCPGLSCAKLGYDVLSCVQIDVTDPENQAGLAIFSGDSITNLLNASTHNIYAEGRDAAENNPQSGTAIITVDSLKPAVDSFVLDTNDVSNDDLVNAPNKLLALLDISYSDLKIDGNNMKVDMTVATSNSDAASVNIYIDPVGEDPEVAANVAVAGGEAKFTEVLVPNGNHALRAVVVDNAGNESDPEDVSVVVDIYSPIPTFNDANGTVSLTQTDCNPDGGYDPCKYNLVVNVAKNANENSSSMDGTVVTLSYPDKKAESSKTIDTFNNGDMDVTFTDFALPQGPTTVTLKARDGHGNELQSDFVTQDYAVDSLAPTVAYTVPATNPVSYTGADDLDTCGGSLNDQYLTICDWKFAVSGINTNNVTLELFVKAPLAADFVKANTPTDNEKILTTDGDWDLSRVDFTENGAYTLKVVITEGTTGNTGESTPLVVNVSDFTPSYVLDYQTLANASFGSGKVFTEEDDKDEVLETVTIDFKVDTRIGSTGSTGTIPEGSTMTLDVNGSVAVQSELISGGIATFTNVVLNEGDENTLKVAVAGLADSTITVLADTEDPVLVFTTPDPFKDVYKASDDSGSADGGVTIGNVTVEVDDFMDTTKTIKLVTASGTLATSTWSASMGPYKYQATFTNVTIPNGAAVTLDVQDNDTSTGALDRAGHAGAVSNIPTMLVDDDPPSAVSGLGVCLGSQTGTDDATFQQDADVCGTQAYGCNGSDARCNRRNGVLTAYWNAAENDDTANSGTASSYEIHIVKQEDIDINNCTPGTDCPCDNITWDTANTLATLTAPLTGVVENAVAAELDVALNTSYCVLVKAIDEAGNYSIDAVSTGRELKYLLTTVDASVVNDAGSLGAHMAWGDLNDDGFADFAISDRFGGAGFGYNGRVHVYYGQDLATTPEHLELLGSAAECLGSGMDIGDVNGDGKDDLIAGAYGHGTCEFAPYYRCDGRFHLLLGQDTKTLSKNYTFDGAVGAFYQLGMHVTALNWDSAVKAADSYKDFFVGTWYDDTNTPTASNQSPIYMMQGRPTANWDTLTGDILTERNLEVHREAGSTEVYSEFGRFMGSGDFDGDGVDDLLIADNNHTDAGGNADH